MMQEKNHEGGVKCDTNDQSPEYLRLGDTHGNIAAEGSFMWAQLPLGAHNRHRIFVCLRSALSSTCRRWAAGGRTGQILGRIGFWRDRVTASAAVKHTAAAAASVSSQSEGDDGACEEGPQRRVHEGNRRPSARAAANGYRQFETATSGGRRRGGEGAVQAKEEGGGDSGEARSGANVGGPNEWAEGRDQHSVRREDGAGGQRQRFAPVSRGHSGGDSEQRQGEGEGGRGGEGVQGPQVTGDGAKQVPRARQRRRRRRRSRGRRGDDSEAPKGTLHSPNNASAPPPLRPLAVQLLRVTFLFVIGNGCSPRINRAAVLLPSPSAPLCPPRRLLRDYSAGGERRRDEQRGGDRSGRHRPIAAPVGLRMRASPTAQRHPRGHRRPIRQKEERLDERRGKADGGARGEQRPAARTFLLGGIGIGGCRAARTAAAVRQGGGHSPQNGGDPKKNSADGERPYVRVVALAADAKEVPRATGARRARGASSPSIAPHALQYESMAALREEDSAAAGGRGPSPPPPDPTSATSGGGYDAYRLGDTVIPMMPTRREGVTAASTEVEGSIEMEGEEDSVRVRTATGPSVSSPSGHGHFGGGAICATSACSNCVSVSAVLS